jgi:hypothetical protein
MLTLQQVKDWLQVEGTEYDTLLDELLDRTIDAVQIELDWYFGPARETEETLSGAGLPTLWLRQPPVDEADVTVTYRTGVGGDWEAVDPDDYEVDGRGITHYHRWTRGRRNYHVIYEEGFTEMPGDVEQLILDLIASKWKGRGDNPGMKSETIGDYSYTRGDMEGSEHWGSVKARWRRGRI